MTTTNPQPAPRRNSSGIACATAIAVAASSAVALPGTALAQEVATPTTTVATTPVVTVSTTATVHVTTTETVTVTERTTVTSPGEVTTVTAAPEVVTQAPVTETVTVEPETATVTVEPETVTAFQQEPPVTVTATPPEKTVTSTATAVVTATQTVTATPNATALEWEPQPVRAGRSTSALLKAGQAAALPDGTTFDTDYPGASVDNTGRVTFAPAVDAPIGATLVPVKATFPDGSTTEYAVRFDVDEAFQSDRFDPAYQKDKGAVPGRIAVVDVVSGPKLPSATRFLLQEENLQGWKVAVDKLTGRISAIAPDNAQPIEPTICVSYGDGSDDYITVPIGVLDPATADSNAEVAFDVTPARAGEATVVKPAGDVPAGAVFEIAPGSTTIARSINPATGEMIVDLPKSALAGSTFTATYRIHFADGSSKDQTVDIPVRSQASEQTVGIQPVEVRAGERETGAAATAPDGTTFALAQSYDAKWPVSVDRTTGRITVTAPAGTPAGASVSIPVVATFADGSAKLVTTSAKVAAAQAPVVTTTAEASGSAEGKGWLWIVLGTLAAIGGIGFAASLNQQWIREQAAQFGIRF